METTERFTLTAADLTVLYITLNETLALDGYISTTAEARRALNFRIAEMLHSMKATITVNSEEPQ